jgi:hypothetical protein
LAKARVEILGAPLFADPPPEWTVDARTSSSDLGKREHITAFWTAPTTVAEAVNAMHDRHGDRYVVRRANSPTNTRFVLEVWNRPGSQLQTLVSYNAVGLKPNRTAVQASIDAPRALLKDPRNRP